MAFKALQDLPPAVSQLPPTTFPLVSFLWPHGPPLYPPNAQRSPQPQGLCSTCCSLCLEHPRDNCLPPLPHLLQVSVQMSLFQRAFPDLSPLLFPASSPILTLLPRIASSVFINWAPFQGFWLPWFLGPARGTRTSWETAAGGLCRLARCPYFLHVNTQIRAAT